MKIYVASSWRNPRQPEVVARLRAEGHEVYDFRNPKEGDKGFHWSEIDPDWQTWTPAKYRDALHHPLAERGFYADMTALRWCECCLYLLPCGRSASLEAGWAAGSGRVTLALLADGEPELMVKMFDYVCLSLDEVIDTLTIVGRIRGPST
jgi:hypothetical protein